MSDKHVFVDTNILVYAHDNQAQVKHTIAKQKIKQLWMQKTPPSISIQVLQELYVNLIRKNVSERDARLTLCDYLEWHVVVNDQTLLLNAINIKEQYKLSFSDSLIIAAAQKASAQVILSEDLQDGQSFGDVFVVNPFKKVSY